MERFPIDHTAINIATRAVVDSSNPGDPHHGNAYAKELYLPASGPSYYELFHHINYEWVQVPFLPSFAEGYAQMMPSYGLNVTNRPRLIITRFGDGYEQRSGDGINPLLSSFNPVFGKIDLTNANALNAFFKAHRGGAPFLFYLPPPERRVAITVCDEWDTVVSGFNSYTVTATLREVLG